jgi:hypothetical protein
MQANAATNPKNKAPVSGKKWRRRWNSEKLADVGKHRKWADDDVAVLSFKVEGKLIHLLDEETKTYNSEQAAGHAAVSRGELVRIALHEWLAARAAARTTKTRQ